MVGRIGAPLNNELSDSGLADSYGLGTISFEDYAMALMDELERPVHLRRRFGVAF